MYRSFVPVCLLKINLFLRKKNQNVQAFEHLIKYTYKTVH